MKLPEGESLYQLHDFYTQKVKPRLLEMPLSYWAQNEREWHKHINTANWIIAGIKMAQEKENN